MMRSILADRCICVTAHVRGDRNHPGTSPSVVTHSVPNGSNTLAWASSAQARVMVCQGGCQPLAQNCHLWLQPYFHHQIEHEQSRAVQHPGG